MADYITPSNPENHLRTLMCPYILCTTAQSLGSDNPTCCHQLGQKTLDQLFSKWNPCIETVGDDDVPADPSPMNSSTVSNHFNPSLHTVSLSDGFWIT